MSDVLTYIKHVWMCEQDELYLLPFQKNALARANDILCDLMW